MKIHKLVRYPALLIGILALVEGATHPQVCEGKVIQDNDTRACQRLDGRGIRIMEYYGEEINVVGKYPIAFINEYLLYMNASGQKEAFDIQTKESMDLSIFISRELHRK